MCPRGRCSTSPSTEAPEDVSSEKRANIIIALYAFLIYLKTSFPRLRQSLIFLKDSVVATKHFREGAKDPIKTQQHSASWVSLKDVNFDMII